MDDIKRMAAVLLVLILIIANLAFGIVSEFEFDDEYTASVQEIKTQNLSEEVWVEQTAEITETEHQETEAVSEAEETTSSGEESHSKQIVAPVIKNGEFENESEAQSIVSITGKLEGLVEKNVFHVTLPVSSNVIEYIADPQGLICKTQSAAYPDSVFDPDSNVYFCNGKVINTENGTEQSMYSGISEPLTVVNKSSCAVSVIARVYADFENGTENHVSIASDNKWEYTSRPSICLSAIRSDDFSETVLGKKEQILTASIKGCPGAYCYKYEGPDCYTYQLMTDKELESFKSDPENADTDVNFKQFSIAIKGECNEDGDWEADTEYSFPVVSVIWNVGFAPSARPYVTEESVSVAKNRENVIHYGLGLLDDGAEMMRSAVYITPEGVERELRWNDYYLVYTEQTVTLTKEFSEYVRGFGGGVLRFQFDDSRRTTTEVVLDMSCAPSLNEDEITVNSDESGQISVGFDTGAGEKSAEGIAKITFGKEDFTEKIYSSVSDNSITLTALALRMIKDKNGGNVYITFDDKEHTRCRLKVKVDK